MPTGFQSPRMCRYIFWAVRFCCAWIAVNFIDFFFSQHVSKGSFAPQNSWSFQTFAIFFLVRLSDNSVNAINNHTFQMMMRYFWICLTVSQNIGGKSWVTPWRNCLIQPVHFQPRKLWFRGDMTCPRSHHKLVAELGLKVRNPDFSFFLSFAE